MSSNYNVSEIDFDEVLERSIGLLKWGYLLTGSVGIACNLPVMAITLKPGLVERDFKWFILNLSLVDVVACLVFVGQSCAYFTLAAYPRALCSVQAFFFFYNYFSIIWALLPVTINRFVSMFYPRISDMFRPATIFCMCALFDTLPALQVAPYGWFGDWGQDPVTGTCTLLEHGGPERATFARLYAFNNTFIWAVFGVTFLLNVALYVKIRKHLGVVLSLDDKQRLKETRELVRATMLQVLTPAMLQLPVTVVDTLSEVLYDDAEERLLFQLLYLVPLMLLVALNPTADALLSMYMLKPYRRVVAAFWQRVTGKQQTVHPLTARRTGPPHARPPHPNIISAQV